MIGFIRAHGYDPGPTQRPLLAGVIAGLLGCLPAGLVFAAFGSFDAAADGVLKTSRLVAAGMVVAAFAVGGLVYGGFFGRAANDRRGGWMLGMAYGFLLWVAAPVTVLPLASRSGMAAGPAATGFLAGFLAWGLVVGLVFPWVHRPLHAGLEEAPHVRRRLGPEVVRLKRRLLHRPL